VLALWAVLGLVLVYVVAAAFTGSTAFRLAHQPVTAIFDLDEAVVVVGEGLSEHDAERLTFDEVRELLRFSLEYLADKGLSAGPGQEPMVAGEGPVFVADDEAVAIVLGRADAARMDVGDDQVFAVLRLLLDHLVEIGAVGPKA
jgi:hypothetical protein